MTASVLVTGAIFRQPEQRTSKTGKPFVMASIKVREGGDTQFWRVLAFSDTTQAELMRLADGDAVTVQGALRAETYDKDGTTKISLSVMADQVLALRQPAKPRAHKSSDTKFPTDNRTTAADPRSFDDRIPF